GAAGGCGMGSEADGGCGMGPGAARARRGRMAAVIVAAVALVALPGQATAATAVGTFPWQTRATGTATGTGAPNPYAFAEGAETVDGATSNVDGPPLSPGKTYESSLPHAGRLYYRLDLQARESAYVSATAVPRLGTRVSYADGVEVSVQDADGNNCSPIEAQEARFGASESPRPITATAARGTGPDETGCAGAGTFYVLVERTSAPESSRADWDLELRVVSEPPLRAAGATAPPRSWNSTTPVPPSGERKRRVGGTSYNTARALDAGVWGDSVAPGRTRYYRVPVDWGQQLSVSAEVGTSSGGRDGASESVRPRGTGYVSSGLVMTLANPVRAEAGDADTAYDGKQKSAALDPLPPVAYENRYATADSVSAMRFAGWYYVSVHLSPEVAEKFGAAPLELTLRVDVVGDPLPGPVYAGASRPADEFGVTERDTEAARRGETAAGSGTGDDPLLAAIAVGGIGTGVTLLVILGVWTLTARRGDASSPAASAPTWDAPVRAGSEPRNRR
ncbi:hypothetical protein, partial [Streptomyces flavofungini]|uniref:hypothetical protein n=1 Tax=Streptomyces flavofungini TaxID=68200 RepID=UPI0034DF04C8